MAKGIIYAMSYAISGVVKIGKTRSNQFDNRLRHLEQNGYSNFTGLKRRFAIEVKDYDEKEHMLHEIFSKSRVANTEFFALDIDTVIQLLSSFEGDQIYPKASSKEDVFDKAYADHLKRSKKSNDAIKEASEKKPTVPDGLYYMTRKFKGNHEPIRVEAVVSNGLFTIKKGQKVSAQERPPLSSTLKKQRAATLSASGILNEDVSFESPSTASDFAIGTASNGWTTWRDAKGNFIDIFRHTAK